FGVPRTDPTEIRMFIATQEYGGSPGFGVAAGSHLSAARRTSELRYCVMTSGQFAIWALICLMIGAPGRPAVALVPDSGRLAPRIAVKIWSAVTGSERCGAGVMTGVGWGVGGATLGGGVLPHAPRIADSAKRLAKASVPRAR